MERGFIKDTDLEPDVEYFHVYLDAFRELSSCRLNGMSIGPIPFTAIVEYSRIYDVGDFQDFHYVIRSMDDMLLSLESKKGKENNNDGSNNASKTDTNKR